MIPGSASIPWSCLFSSFDHLQLIEGFDELGDGVGDVVRDGQHAARLYLDNSSLLDGPDGG